MSGNITQIPALTLEQYKEILSIHYGGELSCRSTDAAWLAWVQQDKQLPSCVQAALRRWKHGFVKVDNPNTENKIKNGDLIWKALCDGCDTPQKIRAQVNLSLTAVRNHLDSFMRLNKLSRHERGCRCAFTYSIVIPTVEQAA